mgnify:CR=1 FL=1
MTTENTDPRNGSSGNSYETGHYGTAPDPSTNPFGPASNGQNSYAGQFHHMAPDNSAFHNLNTILNYYIGIYNYKIMNNDVFSQYY